MSKHIFLSVFAALFATVCVQASQIVVVDSADGSPLSGAAVISNRGVIKGLTDDDGAIGNLSSNDYPVSVRLIGYRDSVFTAVSDTMALVVDDFRLPEVTVSTAARPVTRMLCYIREYSTGCTPKDTLQMYIEAMADVFLADKNVKGYKDGDAKPRLLATRHFTRQADSQGLDSVYVSDDEILVSFIDKQWSVPPLVLHEYDRIKAGERTDTIFGKYGPKNVMRKMPGLLTLKHDALADHKNRVMSHGFSRCSGSRWISYRSRGRWRTYPTMPGCMIWTISYPAASLSATSAKGSGSRKYSRCRSLSSSISWWRCTLSM